MVWFTDFDFDVVFQEAEGDDDISDDINHKISQLSMEVRNVIGRIEGVEVSQWSLQWQMTEMDKQTSSRL